jgi:cell wall-associated NlpC family hydrolase
MNAHEQAQAFVSEALRLRGQRYSNGADGSAGAVDCVHVIIYACKRIGYMPSDYEPPKYAPVGNPPLMEELFGHWFNKVESAESMQEGDIVILREHLPADAFEQTAYPRHCGILLWKDGWVWYGVNFRPEPYVSEVPFTKKFQSRIFGIYRLRHAT